MNENKINTGLSLGICLIAASLVLGAFYYTTQKTIASRDVLSVTGSSKMSVTSDQAKLTLSIRRVVTTKTLASGYTGVASDLQLATDLLTKAGVATTDVVTSPVSMNQIYDNSTAGAEAHYELVQTVTVQSTDVAKITELSKKVPDLATQGAIVSIASLEYYYSKLPDLRVSLLADAVKDAKARAEKIAEGTGRAVGAVESASSGVVQVLPPNSVEVSDYGSYDTSSVQKDVMVTVKASFRLQ